MQIIIIDVSSSGGGNSSSTTTIVECVVHVGSHYMHMVHCIAHVHMCVDSDSLLTLYASLNSSPWQVPSSLDNLRNSGRWASETNV